MSIELKQSLTDPENQPNQFGVEFLLHGEKFAFKIGNQQFTLDYEPSDGGDFGFMREMLIIAFSTFTHDVKTARTTIQQPATGEPVAWLDEMLADTREVFDAGGSETPQVVRDVIEYVKSWVTVYSEKNHPAPAAQPAPSVPDAAIDSAIYNQCPDFDDWHEGPSIDDIRAIVRAALAQQPAASEPVYWEWRHLSTHPDTVDFGQWSKWQRVEARSAIHTIDDALAEFRAYIAQGYKYELRALYDHPAPSVPDDVVRDAERYRFIRDADVSDDLIPDIALYAMESLDEYIDAARKDTK